MRSRIIASTVAILALVSSAARPVEASTAEFTRSVAELVDAFEGTAGLWISDPASARPVYSANADEPVIAASLYKLAILLHAESLVDTRRLAYADTLTIRAEDVRDSAFTPAGTVLTIDQALEVMITVSDNSPALALLHRFGFDALNATLRQQRVPDFHIQRDVNDENTVTARAVGTFFERLARRELVSAAASARMLSRLERQQVNDRLPRRLPAGARVAHKTGDLIGYTHDAGIVQTPRGARIVVALTWDAGPGQAYEFIAALGALSYAAVLDPVVSVSLPGVGIYQPEPGAAGVVALVAILVIAALVTLSIARRRSRSRRPSMATRARTRG